MKRVLVLMVSVGMIATGIALAQETTEPAQEETSQAQEETSSKKGVSLVLKEVTVTARKREENLLEVPLSITVIENEELLRANIDSVSDYVVRTPNMTFANNGNASRSILAMRGVTDINVAATGSSIGFYVDEVSVNPTGGLRQNDMALLDLERIEVLRGPQGTLFGRNTIGGAINLVTRKPDNEMSARLTGGHERFGTYYIQGFANVPLIDDLLAVRLSGVHNHSDGFVENSFLGRNFNNGRSGGRVAVRARPSDSLVVDLTAQQLETRFDGIQTILEPEFDAGGLDSPVNYLPGNIISSQLYTARLTYSVSAFDVISLTAYNAFEMTDPFDADGGSAGDRVVDRFTDETNFSQELRLQSTNPNSRVQWTLGAFYGKTKDNLAYDLIGYAPVTLSRASSGEVENRAFFGQADIQITDAVALIAGARYSRDDVRRVHTNGAVFEGPSDAVTPKVGLRYTFNENLHTYVTASRGYKPGGFDVFFTDTNPDDNITAAYDPETAWNYEAGVKVSAYGGRLVADAAIFYLDWQDLQVPFQFDVAEQVTTNAAKARSIGGEIQIAAYPTDNLFLQMGLGILDAEFTNFVNSPEGDLTGNKIPYAPPMSFNVVGEYSRPITDNVEGLFRAEYSFTSEREGRSNNNDIERLPAYDLLNLRAGITVNRFELWTYGENVLDERWFSNRRPGRGTPASVTVQHPATWGFRATVRF